MDGIKELGHRQGSAAAELFAGDDATEAMRHLLMGRRFVCWVDPAGRLMLREMDPGAHVPVARLAESIANRELVPAELLPQIQQALETRLD